MKYLKIKKIEPARSEPVYHLTVEKNHNFFANDLLVHNCGYRGEIKFRFKHIPNTAMYQVGDRVGQLIIVPYPTIELDEVSELSSTERNDGGFGSTN